MAATMHDLLTILVERSASDLHITTGSYPQIRVHGGLTPLSQFEVLTPHLNIGFTLSGDSDSEFVRVTDEFNYTAGTEVVLSPRLTITGDLVGRNLIDSGRLVEEPKTFNWRTAAGVAGSSTFVEFAAQPGNLNLLLGAAGVRYNPGRNLLISGSVLFPLTDAGIRSEIIPVVGFEYAF